MARTRIIEGTWDCTSCGSKGVLGRHKVCPGCGNPRERSSESNFDFGPQTESGASTRETVTDAQALDAAQAGADWYCGFCGTANRGDASVCRACSAERESKAEEPAQVGVEAAMAPQSAAETIEKPRRGCLKPALLGCLGLGGALLALLVGLGIWGTRTRDEQGLVVSRSWKREIARETFSRLSKTAWRDEITERRSVMPLRGSGEVAGAERIRDCRRMQRGTRQVATGTKRVCTDRTRRVQCGTEEKCRRKDLGNGFAEEVCDDVPKYCSESYRDCEDETQYRTEPVHADQCTYDSWEWRSASGATAQGTDDAPRWPELALGDLDRERRSESYAVKITYGEGNEYTLEPKSAEEFARYKSGTSLRLKVNNFGDVVEAQSAN